MSESYDVVVVGAGSGGGVLASLLSEDASRSVLLVEAGPDFGPALAAAPAEVRDAYDVGPTTCDWGYEADLGTAGRRSPVFAGRLVGGSSATNNTMALRGQPDDYDAWARAGNPGWAFDDVLDAFRRVEDDRDFGRCPWHGDDGPVAIGRQPEGAIGPAHAAFLSACARSGCPEVADHNAPGAVGVGRLPLNEVGGERQSVAVTYLAEARQRRNLAIRAGAVVDRLLVEAGRVTGLVLAGDDGGMIRTGHVVLAAGTYGSPAILLRSGIGPAARLRELGVDIHADLPGVGANLHDHPLVRLSYASGQPPAGPPLQSLLTFSSTGAGPPDLQIFPSGPRAVGRGAELTLIVALLAPRSRGGLRLGSPDPTDPPRINLGVLSDPDDLPRLTDGVRYARQLARSAPLAGLLDGEPRPGADLLADEHLGDAIRAHVNVYQHPVGTCRMGAADDPAAVVDAAGRVHGIDGLQVADASIMPAIPRANTNLPTLMLAERIGGPA